MAQFFVLHPVNPQLRLLRRAVEMLHEGSVVVIPTDSAWALCCHLADAAALERIRAIRKTDRHHNFTLLCADLSSIATYAKVDNATYRLLKQLTPGPYTFILPGTRELPRRILHEHRKSVGLRIPAHSVVQALLLELGEPLLSTTLLLEEEPLLVAETIRERLEHQVDLILDCEVYGQGLTTVLDMTTSPIKIVRQGLGATDMLTTA